MIEVYKFILTDILPQLNSKNMKLILDFESNTVGTGELECSGYFDDDEKELVVAVGDKKVEDWFTTLLHEFCHFQQWKEQCPVWIESQPEDQNSDDFLDDYLKGRDCPNIQSEVRKIALLEYDCEVRTTQMLKSAPKVIDTEVYVQKSNAYIAFYFQMLKRRSWYKAERAPYLNESIYLNMPKVFLPFEEYFESYIFDELDWDSCFEEKSDD